MAASNYAPQIQQQHQDPGTTAAPPPSPAAPADTGVDASIAAFMADNPDAEGGETDESLADTDASDSPALAQVPDDEDTESADDSSTDETEDEAPELGSSKLDLKKLVEAVDAKNLPMLLEALGPAAEELLSSKAHKTLRLQAKELLGKQREAEKAAKRAETLESKLTEKYSDPHQVRTLIEKGDPAAVDAFIDYVEKTTGSDWNSVIRWAAKGLVGRKERLATKAKAAETETATQTAKQTEAIAATKTWVNAGIKAKDAALLDNAPELTDMVIEEIRQGYSRGIDTPAKAIPLALKKLRAQHERLSKVFGATPGKGKKTEAPAARVNKPRERNGEVREMSLDESIADFIKENGLK